MKLNRKTRITNKDFEDILYTISSALNVSFFGLCKLFYRILEEYYSLIELETNLIDENN